MQNKDEIYARLRLLLEDMFEISPNDIHPESLLYDDLDVDSIDAVDLVIELRRITGKQIDPDDFKAVRSVDDVVKVVATLLELK